MTRAASKASLIQNAEEIESGGGRTEREERWPKKEKKKELLQNKSDIEWSLGKIFLAVKTKEGKFCSPRHPST